MAAQFPKGTVVHQIASVMSGTVQSFSVDQETGDIQYFVEYEGLDGTVHSRYFKDDELALTETVHSVGSPVVLTQ